MKTASSRPKWHLVYFVLAAFDLITVSAGLYLNHRLMDIYTQSVAVNQQWADRLGQYSDLAQLAGAVNAPGNDVFDSLDVAGESGRMQKARSEFDAQVAKIRKEITDGEKESETAPLLGDLEAITTAMDAMTAEANLIFSYFGQNQPDKAGSRMATMDRKYGEVNAAFANLNLHVREIQHLLFTQQIDMAKSLRRYEYIIAVFIVLMIGGVTFYGHKIAQEMGKITEEREQHVANLRENERRLRQQIAMNYQQQTHEVSEVVSSLTAAFSQISVSLRQLLASTSETAAAVTQTATTVEEVRHTATLVKQKTYEVTSSAQGAVQIAQTGEMAVEHAHSGLASIRAHMESIAKRVVTLGDQTQTISDIIATVKELAEQSNLLAINAAIEAAKAGEHGKGFAVVAQEVRHMAEQSKQAAVQVRTILQDIQDATHAAVSVTEQGAKVVEVGLQQSLEAGESIQTLSRRLTDTAMAMQQIAASSEQQLLGMEQVSSAMVSVKGASGQNVSGIRQIESAAHELERIGQTLRQSIERLKVVDDGASPP